MRNPKRFPVYLFCASCRLQVLATMIMIEPLHQSSLVQYLINLELPTVWWQFRCQSRWLSRFYPFALQTPLPLACPAPPLCCLFSALHFPPLLFLSPLLSLPSGLLPFLVKNVKCVKDSRFFEYSEND